MQGCTSVLFFEARKKKDLYVWLAKAPEGPSVKFYVTNGVPVMIQAARSLPWCVNSVCAILRAPEVHVCERLREDLACCTGSTVHNGTGYTRNCLAGVRWCVRCQHADAERVWCEQCIRWLS